MDCEDFFFQKLIFIRNLNFLSLKYFNIKTDHKDYKYADFIFLF